MTRIVGNSGDDDRNRRNERVRARHRTETTKPTRPPRTEHSRDRDRPDPIRDRDRSETRPTRTVASLDRDTSETQSDPVAARGITNQQAETAADLTGRSGSSPSFAALAAEEDKETAAAEGRTLLRDGEYINPSDAHLYNRAEEASAAAEEKREAAAAEGRTLLRDGEYINPSDAHLYALAEGAPTSPLGEANRLERELEEASDPQLLISQQVPSIMASLENANPEVVTQTMAQFSQIAHDNPQLADTLAQQFGDHPPQNLSATLEGLAGSSAAGRPELAGAIATLFESNENPSADQFRSVANLSDAVSDIHTALEPGSLQGAGQAGDRISSAIADAPPEVAQALLNQMGIDGSLEQISGILDQAANEDGVDGDMADPATGFLPNNPLAELGDGETSSLQQFDRVIGSLSQAVTAAGDDEITHMVAGHITSAVGEGDIRRFDESFALTIANAGGAGLAGAVATQLNDAGNTDMADKVAEGVEAGFDIYLDRFDGTADQVDQANNDLAYQLSQWGPFYGNDEAGQAALNERVEAFRTNHPEYADLDRISATAGGDLEVLRQLRGEFPEKEDLHDRELRLLAEVPRFGQTDSGRRSLGEAVARRGEGEETFLDRLDDPDFIDSLPDDYYEKQGYEDRASFQVGLSQQVLNGSLSLLSESAQQGDSENLGNIESGLLEYHEFLGEDREALAEVLDANSELITSSAIVGREGSGTGAELLNNAADRLASATDGLENAATANRFRAGGAVAALGAGAFSWWAASRDGLELPEALEASVDTLDGLLAAGGTANTISSGRLLSQFSDDLVSKGGKFFGAAGAILDGYSLVRAAQEGDWAQAGISAVSVAGGIATALGATGVGLALGLGAAALGLGYAQYQKVEASNRFETSETEGFIRGALEQAGVQNDQMDEVVRHLRNADSDGRNVGILIAQAAERRGMAPIDLLSAIARQDPGKVLDIVETGHGIDPQSDDLNDLAQTHETDGRVGQASGSGRVASAQVQQPRSVEGFLVYLENVGII